MDLKIVLLCTHYYWINGDRECNAANFKQSRFSLSGLTKFPDFSIIFVPIFRYFLPAATKLGQGNIFRSVCQEFCPQGGGGWVWSRGGLQIFGGVSKIFFLFFQFFPPKNSFWDAPTPPPPRRSMRGRYASYWNAFLLSFVFLLKTFPILGQNSPIFPLFLFPYSSIFEVLFFTKNFSHFRK